MVDFKSLLTGAAGGAAVTIVIKAVDQFSGTFKQAGGGIEGLTAAASKFGKVGIAGAVAGLGAFSISAINATKEIQPLRSSFKNLAKDSDRLFQQLKESTRGTVSEFELLSSANKALLLGLDQDALPSLFKNAAIVGRAAGRTTTEAINDITLGIGRQSRLILDNLGIIVKAEEAYERYALSIGKATSELTENEKRAAFTQAAVASLEQKAAQLGDTIGEGGLKTETEKLDAEWQNFKITMGELVTPALAGFFKDVNEIWIPGIKGFTGYIGELIGKIIELTDAWIKFNEKVMGRKAPEIGGYTPETRPERLITPARLYTPAQTYTPANFTPMRDFIFRPGQKPVSFSPDDTIIGAKGGVGMTIVINGDNYGVSAEQIAEALHTKLKRKISL